MPAPESYPDDLHYHPEHDWARIDGEEATLGITWFAQDSLGELVQTVNDDPYGDGWLIRIRTSDPSELDVLMDAAAYSAHVADQ
jgi:glycine cleavage system H protein